MHEQFSGDITPEVTSQVEPIIEARPVTVNGITIDPSSDTPVQMSDIITFLGLKSSEKVKEAIERLGLPHYVKPYGYTRGKVTYKTALRAEDVIRLQSDDLLNPQWVLVDPTR